MYWSKDVEDLVQGGTSVQHRYKPTDTLVKKIGDSVVYIKADMDTDADGSPRATQIDPDGLLETSLSSKNGWEGAGQYVDAETIPYFVLPISFNSLVGITFELGDLCLIRWRGKEAFAIFADKGPRRLIGEGSIKLVELLGGNPWNSSKTKIVTGLPFGVEYLAFANSRATYGLASTLDEIQALGKKALNGILTDS